MPARSLAVVDEPVAVTMLGTINLDDEMCRQAGEISNVISERDLPSKMSAARFETAQVTPENCFGVGGIVAKTPGCGAFEIADWRSVRHYCSPHPAAFGGDPPPPGEGGRKNPSPQGGGEQALMRGEAYSAARACTAPAACVAYALIAATGTTVAKRSASSASAVRWICSAGRSAPPSGSGNARVAAASAATVTV